MQHGNERNAGPAETGLEALKRGAAKRRETVQETTQARQQARVKRKTHTDGGKHRRHKKAEIYKYEGQRDRKTKQERG